MNSSRKAVIEIEAKSDVRRGVQDAERQLNELRTPLNNLQKLAGMAFAGASIYGMVRGIKDVVQASAKQQAIFNDLRATVEHLGISYDAVSGSLQKTFRHLQDVTTYGDTDSARVLTDLITLTGDYEGSLKALPLVLDMAASGQFDVRTAARYMAMAMKGNITMLGRYIPELRSSSNALMAHATEAQKAEYAMKMLEKHFGGRAQAETKTTIGQYKQLANEFSDLKEAIGDLIDEPLAEFFHMAAKAIRGFTSLITPDVPEQIGSNSAAIQHEIDVIGKYIDQLKKHNTDLKTAKEAMDIMAAAGYSQAQALNLKNLQKELDTAQKLLKTARDMDNVGKKEQSSAVPTQMADQEYQKRLTAYQKQQKAAQENFKKIKESHKKFNDELLKMQEERLGISIKQINDANRQELDAIQNTQDKKLRIQLETNRKMRQQSAAELEYKKMIIKAEANQYAQLYGMLFGNIGQNLDKHKHVLKDALKDSLDPIINYVETEFLAAKASKIIEAALGGLPLSITGLAEIAAGYVAVESLRSYFHSHFHTGGIVPGYGNEIPAVLQGGERVISKEIYRERRVQIEQAISGSEEQRPPQVINQFHINALDVDSFRKYMRRKGYDVMDQDAGLGYL